MLFAMLNVAAVCRYVEVRGSEGQGSVGWNKIECETLLLGVDLRDFKI